MRGWQELRGLLGRFERAGIDGLQRQQRRGQYSRLGFSVSISLSHVRSRKWHPEARTKCCSFTNIPPPMMAIGAGVGADMVNEAVLGSRRYFEGLRVLST